MNPYAPLFTPFKLGGLTLKNRVVMSPMTTRLGGSDNQITERMIDFLAERAAGGAAMITTEAFYVAKRFAGANTVALDDNQKIPMLASLCEAVHAKGAKLCVQLGCGLGRYDGFEKNGEPPKTSSAIPTFAKPEVLCSEMTLDEIQKVVREYQKAAQRVVRAGGDAINIHGHNGYLIDQFMSAQFNTRTDEYGGSLENRMRYPREIIAAVRKAVGPAIPIIFRFSVDLCFQGARGMEESLDMLRMLEHSGIDALDLDTGATESMDWIFTPYFLGEACELYVAEEARKAGITLPILNSGAHNPDTALNAIQSGAVDLVMMGRALIADPQLPNKLLGNRREEVRPCLRCNEYCSKRSLSTGAYLSCAVNGAAGNEARFSIREAGEKKRVAVIGAGPAGMEAARIAALRGHSVTVYEKNGTAAALLYQVAKDQLKTQMKRLLLWQEAQLVKLGVEIKYHSEVTKDSPFLKAADAILVAIGALPALPSIPGVESALTIREAYVKPEQIIGDHIVIAGGSLSACEFAIELASTGKHITLVECQKKVASDCYGINRTALNRMLKNQAIEQKTLHRVTAITAGTLTALNEMGEEVLITGDTIINALGSVPNASLGNTLMATYPGLVSTIGACTGAGSVGDSIRSAYFVALSL